MAMGVMVASVCLGVMVPPIMVAMGDEDDPVYGQVIVVVVHYWLLN
jgi:hypothetical protein